MLKHYTRTNWTYCSDLILNPRHKLETFNLTSWGREIKKESFLKFKGIYKKYEPQNLLPGLKVEEAESNNVDEDTIDVNILYSAPSTSTRLHGSKRELKQYSNEPRTTANEDILQWWKNYQSRFPTISKMAQDILSISGTSVPSEKLFSKPLCSFENIVID